MSESERPPSDRAGFDELLVQSVQETIAGILGRTVSDAFINHLQAYIGITLEEMPNHPAELFKALRGSFGVGGDRVGKYIVRKLYQKAGVEFLELDGHTLVDYVQTLKTRLAGEELK